MACKWGALLNLLLSLNKQLQMPSAAGMRLRAKNLDLDTNLLMMRKMKHVSHGDGKFVRSDHEQADHHHRCGNWHVCAFNSEACDKLHTEGIQSQPNAMENAQRILLLQHEESRANYQDGCNGAVGAHEKGGEQRCKGGAQIDAEVFGDGVLTIPCAQ